MVRKHISREYSSHRKDKIRPIDEFYKVEIISYDHELTKTYYYASKNITGVNTKIVQWKGWSAYVVDNEEKNSSVTCDYFVEKKGEYRVEIFYENYIKPTVSVELSIVNKPVKFEGSINHLKRKTFFVNLEEGNQSIKLNMTSGMYFYGMIIRKTKEYVGDSLSSAGTNLLLEKVDTTFSSQIAPAEGSFEIAYDNAFECLTTSTGLYMDYNDEVNVYIKGKDTTEPTQVFGGYLSAIQPDKDRTSLTVSCADTMIGGQNKYILSQMRLLGGATVPSESAYNSSMDINFDTYGEALKYLCNSLELTLNNNIGDNNLVTGETAKKGFNIEFGKKKTIKKVTCKNASAEFSKNFVTIRNNASATKKQTIILYNGKDHRTTPVEITNYPNFSIVYGLGDAETSHDEKTTETVDKGEGNAGSQTFTKCGVSADGKYIMAIGLPSASGDESLAGGIKWKKRMFKNECPYCKSRGMASNKLVFDIFYGNSVGAGRSECNNGRYESGGGVEGHIFCRTCDSDYSIMSGKRHGGTGGNLTAVSKLMDSSKAEAKKLKAGKFSATATGVSLSADDIFDAIWKLAKQKKLTYKLRGTTYKTASDLEKHGVGDCWAFSDWIFKQLKGYKVNCRIVQYATKEAPNGTHRSVQYKNSKGKWTDYPYRSHGWNNYLYNTEGSKHPNSIVKKYTAGGNIDQAVSKSGSSTETTTTKVTEGYSRDKPIQGYFEVTYSTTKSFKAKTTSVIVGFTQKAGTLNSISGFNPIWINNSVKRLNVDLLDFIKDSISEEATTGEKRYYLHSIKFVAPVNKVVDTDATAHSTTTKYKVEDWYTYDKSTHDNSSCKMDIYSINFNDATLINPTDLESCGKSVNALFEDILTASKYTASRVYAKHRCDDSINFAVDNKTKPVFVAQEGDENNILEISGVSYTPRSSLFNNSTVVFKDSTQKYKYVETHDVESIFRYGEQTTLQTASEVIGAKEAYYNAVNNTNYNPVEQFNFTLTLPYFVDVNVGDLVQTIANSRKLNTIKTVTSVKYDCDHKQIPKIQTTLGLGELPVDLQIAKDLREIRALAKKQTTYFSGSAEPVMEDIYVWDN